jgi:3-isopropylmalate/(R)-2-methylmalate dehydratase large subunit
METVKMGMTITEKIFARGAGQASVKAGDLVNAKVDGIMCHDVTTPPAISMLREKGIDTIFDKEKLYVTPDHFQPPKDIKSAELHKRLDKWARENNLPYYYPLGKAGVCHALLPEQGHIRPGEVIVGGDSHTCTYGAFGCFSAGIGSTDLAAAISTGELWFKVPASMRFTLDGSLPFGVYSKDVVLEAIRRIGTDGALYRAIEYVGPAIKEMSMEARMTITNMAIEAGGKNAIMAADEVTEEYLAGRLQGRQDYDMFQSDPDAEYVHDDTIDCSVLEPLVAFPHLPSNGIKISECQGKEMDQAYLGSCTNGRIEDYRIAAEIMKGKEVRIRTLVVPTTPEVWKQANDEGLLNIFYDAGCIISAPTCGACLGGFMGVLGAEERCISSTNRNFVGRMGHPTSLVHLASPATVAASAIEGKLADPRNYL